MSIILKHLEAYRRSSQVKSLFSGKGVPKHRGHLNLWNWIWISNEWWQKNSESSVQLGCPLLMIIFWIPKQSHFQEMSRSFHWISFCPTCTWMKLVRCTQFILFCNFFKDHQTILEKWHVDFHFTVTPFSTLILSIFEEGWWSRACHTGFRISVPRPGIEPGPWQWKSRTLTTKPPGIPSQFISKLEKDILLVPHLESVIL